MHSDKIPFDKQYRLRAMATHPDFHGRGLAKALILHSVEILKEKQQEVLWCDARLNAVGFYKRLGFRQIDEVYEVPKIGPHKFMWFKL
jgi:ribosomal protein S18 acetylase RimI-like enzyme